MLLPSLLVAGTLLATTAGPALAADARAFLQPSPSLTLERGLDFKVGEALFQRLWVSAPASTQAADGLGPLYNARSCLDCHAGNGRGHAPDGPDDNALSLVLHLSAPPRSEEERRLLAENRLKFIPEPTYGNQIQDFAIQGHTAEGRVRVDYRERALTLADGEVIALREPLFRVDDLRYGPLDPGVRISPRIAPPMIGLGLLEAIDEAAILAHADPEDRDGDGISGRPNYVWSRAENRGTLGRYGWKAGSPSVDEQSQAAFANDLGISTPLYPAGAGDCTAAQEACQSAPSGNSPQFDHREAHRQVTDLVSLYVRHLAVPAQRGADTPQVRAGERLFRASGCAACHTPEYVTRNEGVDPELAGQRIRPYSDLLLHDMGEGLADGRPEGAAGGREWRTAPLWGIGLTEAVSGEAGYLHDGRARTLLEAVLWHGGEAQAARDAVVRMTRAEREALLAFVGSL